MKELTNACTLARARVRTYERTHSKTHARTDGKNTRIRHLFRMRIGFEEKLPVLSLKREKSRIEIFAILCNVSEGTTEPDEDTTFGVGI